MDVWEEPSGGTTPQARQPDGRRVCYLTFDDGPSDKTLEILDILDKYRIKATFFVIESENIEYVKKNLRGGAYNRLAHRHARLFGNIFGRGYVL